MRAWTWGSQGGGRYDIRLVRPRSTRTYADCSRG